MGGGCRRTPVRLLIPRTLSPTLTSLSLNSLGTRRFASSNRVAVGRSVGRSWLLATVRSGGRVVHSITSTGPTVSATGRDIGMGMGGSGSHSATAAATTTTTTTTTGVTLSSGVACCCCCSRRWRATFLESRRRECA